MIIHPKFEDETSFNDSFEENPTDAQHKKEVRRLIEEKLEEKRLREELEDEFELDSEFDWDDTE